MSEHDLLCPFKKLQRLGCDVTLAIQFFHAGQCADSESNREPTDSYHFGFRRRSIVERSWSGLCLRLRRNAVRRVPSSLYTFPGCGAWLGVGTTVRTTVHRL